MYTFWGRYEIFREDFYSEEDKHDNMRYLSHKRKLAHKKAIYDHYYFLSCRMNELFPKSFYEINYETDTFIYI